MSGKHAAGEQAMCDEDELLLRYHFGDVTDSERADFESRLEAEPSLRDRLEALRECMEANGGQVANCSEASTPPLPRQLAHRTTEVVLTADTDAAESCVGRKRFSLVETVAIGVAAMVMGALVFPAIQASRDASRRITCENGMLDVSQALFQYADHHGEQIPTILPGQNAGMFAVKLADAGYIDRKLLQRQLICPSSELATQVAEGRAAVMVPTMAEMQVAPSFLLDRLRRFMAGSYAYRLGYLEGQTYVNAPLVADCRSAILADAPARGCGRSVVSKNHGVCGQNVLYEDGHVAFQAGCWSPDHEDHLFLNDAGQMAAGRTPQDSVLGRSEATPGVVRVIRIRF